VSVARNGHLHDPPETHGSLLPDGFFIRIKLKFPWRLKKVCRRKAQLRRIPDVRSM
jgi:hypothetical protein